MEPLPASVEYGPLLAALVVIFFLVRKINRWVSRPPSPPRRPLRRAYYRTRDGGADYRFSFEQVGQGAWRVYIVDQPSYGNRSTGCHETHRLRNRGRHYICWTGKLRSEEEARRVAAQWADKTQEYIRSGVRF